MRWVIGYQKLISIQISIKKSRVQSLILQIPTTPHCLPVRFRPAGPEWFPSLLPPPLLSMSNITTSRPLRRFSTTHSNSNKDNN